MQLSTGSLYKLNKDIPFTKPIFLQLMGKREGQLCTFGSSGVRSLSEK